MWRVHEYCWRWRAAFAVILMIIANLFYLSVQSTPQLFYLQWCYSFPIFITVASEAGFSLEPAASRCLAGFSCL